MPPRQTESYSSLDKFLNAPHQWVLEYAARISPSDLLAIAADKTLYGNLAHRLIELYFTDPGALARQPRDLETWYGPTFDRVLAEEGAVLLMRGRRADLERLRAVLLTALRELQRQLVAAGVDQVAPERALAGHFTGGALQGSADLVVRNRSGHWAIVDIKWSGGTYRQEQLTAGRHLQLAVYAEMLRQATGAWPQVAFFILESARLLTLDNAFFPEGLVVKGGDARSTPVLWQQCQAAWAWRRAQLDRGRIELVLEDVEPTDESTPPDTAFVPAPSGFDDFQALTGWSD
jgi:RecB family exonuclease